MRTPGTVSLGWLVVAFVAAVGLSSCIDSGPVPAGGDTTDSSDTWTPDDVVEDTSEFPMDTDEQPDTDEPPEDTEPMEDSGDTATAPDVNCDAGPEMCDGKDNDCDGMTDENLTRTCGKSTGVCTRGMETCSSGSWGSCEGSTSPSSESCDGKDNDCDGMTDEVLCNASFESVSKDGTCERAEGWEFADKSTGYTSNGNVCSTTSPVSDGSRSYGISWTGNSSNNKADVWQSVELAGFSFIEFDMLGPSGGNPERSNHVILIDGNKAKNCGHVTNGDQKTCSVSVSGFNGVHEVRHRWKQRTGDNLGNSKIDNFRLIP